MARVTPGRVSSHSLYMSNGRPILPKAKTMTSDPISGRPISGRPYFGATLFRGPLNARCPRVTNRRLVSRARAVRHVPQDVVPLGLAPPRLRRYRESAPVPLCLPRRAARGGAASRAKLTMEDVWFAVHHLQLNSPAIDTSKTMASDPISDPPISGPRTPFPHELTTHGATAWVAGSAGRVCCARTSADPGVVAPTDAEGTQEIAIPVGALPLTLVAQAIMIA